MNPVVVGIATIFVIFFIGVLLIALLRILFATAELVENKAKLLRISVLVLEEQMKPKEDLL